ncbi:MAG: hypothetical protein JW748_07600 [Anaerolineales bacterium]|nr:hypothetical protein [Anaerolineales bacterium]
MADVIHMDSDPVQEIGRKLTSLSGKILDAQTEISRAAQAMDWAGSGKDSFLQDEEYWAGKMYYLSRDFSEMGSAVTKEREEWEDTAKEFVKRHTPFVQGDGDKHAVDISDIQQGDYGDCFFMSSMGAIAREHPEFIQNMIHDNGDGTYTVTFYDPICATPLGPCIYKKHEITVDGKFPKGLADPTDATADGTQEAWTLILEKAYLQWQRENGIDPLTRLPLLDLPSPSNAMSVMTGKDCFNCPSELMTIDDLNRRFQNGDAITAGSDWEINPNRPTNYFEPVPPLDTAILEEGHVYFVTGVDPIANTVTIQNPWGPHCPPITMPFEDYQKCFWLTTSNSVE